MSSGQGKEPSSLGKAIIFRAGEKIWACELNKVKEIVRISYITPLPNSQKGVLGIINVRGEVVPVLSSWSSCSQDQGAATYEEKKKHTVVLLRAGNESIGLLVDEIKALEEIHAYDLHADHKDCPCMVFLSQTGQVPLVDGKLIIEHLKAGIDSFKNNHE